MIERVGVAAAFTRTIIITDSGPHQLKVSANIQKINSLLERLMIY